MSIDREKLCGGCVIYKGPPPCFNLCILKSGEKCPCTECLVKTTCENVCVKFSMYAEKSNNQKRKDTEHLKKG